MARKDAVEDLLGDASPMFEEAEAGEWGAAVQPRTATKEAKPKEQRRIRKTKTVTKKKPPAQRTAERKQPKPEPPRRQGDPEPLLNTKRMKVSAIDDQLIDELVMRLGRAVGVKLQFSNVGRALFSLLQDAENMMDEIDTPALRRPENKDLDGLMIFEEDLGDYLHALIRELPKRRQER